MFARTHMHTHTHTHTACLLYGVLLLLFFVIGTLDYVESFIEVFNVRTMYISVARVMYIMPIHFLWLRWLTCVLLRAVR